MDLWAQDFQGINGFLGSRAALMTDVVFLAMFVIVPVMVWSIQLVRRGPTEANLVLHKRVQTILGVVLLVAVVAFEIDVRFISDWEERAEASPYYQKDVWSVVWTALSIHLFFAVPTLVLWIVVIVRAYRNFDAVPRPNAHSRAHRFWARLAAIGMTMTAITGWIFYYLAFVVAV